jgi:hypothetical protein
MVGLKAFVKTGGGLDQADSFLGKRRLGQSDSGSNSEEASDGEDSQHGVSDDAKEPSAVSAAADKKKRTRVDLGVATTGVYEAQRKTWNTMRSDMEEAVTQSKAVLSQASSFQAADDASFKMYVQTCECRRRIVDAWLAKSSNPASSAGVTLTQPPVTKAAEGTPGKQSAEAPAADETAAAIDAKGEAALMPQALTQLAASPPGPSAAAGAIVLFDDPAELQTQRVQQLLRAEGESKIPVSDLLFLLSYEEIQNKTKLILSIVDAEVRQTTMATLLSGASGGGG